MKLKSLLKTCINTVDSVRFLGISKDDAPMPTYIKDTYFLSDAELSAEVCKWSVEHIKASHSDSYKEKQE